VSSIVEDALAFAEANFPERREPQLKMMESVCEFLEAQTPTLIEAGTGTGKSFAYLVPAMLWLQEHPLDKIVVSTGTKALQRQLVEKDIKALQKHFPGVKVAIAKSASNYACAESIAPTISDLESTNGSVTDLRILKKLEGYVTARSGWDGDLDKITGNLDWQVRERIAYSHDSPACDSPGVCYLKRRFQELEEAQLIITNHAMLMTSMRHQQGLPQLLSMVIVDEGHKLPDVTRDAFTETLRQSSVERFVKRVLREEDSNRLEPYYRAVLDANNKLWQEIKYELKKAAGKSQWAQIVQTTENSYGLRLSTELSLLKEALKNKLWKIYMQSLYGESDYGLTPEEIKEAKHRGKLINTCNALSAQAALIFKAEEPNEVYAYVWTMEAQDVRAEAIPIDVGELLQRYLYEEIPTFLTSATLAHSKGALGFDSKQHVTVLDSVFDYERQSIMYVPKSAVLAGDNRDSDHYFSALANTMLELVRITKGRGFLLFTSRYDMEKTYELLTHPLLDEGYYPIIQGQNGAGPAMHSYMTANRPPVLFGLKSFWEGVDIQGEQLSLVVLSKLPFEQQTVIDKILQSDAKLGFGKWWTDLYLPRLITNTQQSLGRLIRTTNDIGVVACLDARIFTKQSNYGQKLVSSLPFTNFAVQTSQVREWWSTATKGVLTHAAK